VRLAQRLLLGALLLIGVLVVTVVALSGGRLRTRLVELQLEQLTREARLAAVQWTAGADVDSLADAAGAALGFRVTLIDPAGRVLGDSEFDGEALARLENHAARPEVADAVAGGRGWSRRVSPSAGDEELYAAVRAARGVARVSMSTAQLDAIVWRGQREVLSSGLAAVVVAALLALLFAREVSRPIVRLRDVAQALAAGDLSRRPALTAPGEVGDLSSAVHRMAEELDRRMRQLEADDVLLEATVESLNEGVVVLDAARRVIRVNQAGRRLPRSPTRVPFPPTASPATPPSARRWGRRSTGGRAAWPRSRSPDRTACRARWRCARARSPAAGRCSRCSTSRRSGGWRPSAATSWRTSRTSSRRRSP
jgi:HAMP domain-containing protein